MKAKSKAWIFPLLFGLIILAVVFYFAYFNAPVYKVSSDFKTKIAALPQYQPGPDPDGLYLGTGVHITQKFKTMGDGRGDTATADASDKVHAFFKGINVEATSWIIGLLKDDIKQYLNSGAAVRSERINVGDYL